MIRSCAPVFFVATALAAPAATITNASFESDLYTVWPGYIAGNGGTLTGWTGSDTSRTGLNARPATWNPVNANATPFANNGLTPNGTQSALVQAATATPNTSLSTTITDLIPGETYRVTFRFTSRNNGPAANQRPNASATVGGYSVNFQVNPLEAANTFTLPYRTASLVFTAAAATEVLTVSNAINPAIVGQTDTTLVIDDFQIAAAAPTQWMATAWTGDATSGINSAFGYTHAVDLGSSATGSTINGVTFSGVAGANPAQAGSFSTTGWTSPLGGDVNALTLAGGGSGTIATDFVYGGASQTAQTLTLESLTPGAHYHLTLFGVGWSDAAMIARGFTFNNDSGDSLTMNEHQFGVDNGVKFEFDYFADAASETFTLNPTSSVTTFHLYGFANALIPEPGVASLGLLGLAALRRRRR